MYKYIVITWWSYPGLGLTEGTRNFRPNGSSTKESVGYERVTYN